MLAFRLSLGVMLIASMRRFIVLLRFGCCVAAASLPAIVLADTAPAITTQPVSQTALAGTTVVFSVEATGTNPLSYQWYYSGLLRFFPINGQTGPSLTLNNVQQSNAGTYYVSVSNGAGTVTSNQVTLTVNSPPSITSQPQSVSAALGSSAIFQVVATGSPTLGYQWLKDGAPISGATSGTFTISVIHSADAGSYTVKITNAYGSATSLAAVLAIVPGYTFFTIAGTAGPAGNVDGMGTAARFNGPTGIAVDIAGYVYVADTGNDTIRKISPVGAVSTLAGMAGQSGSADGKGANARFNLPRGIAVDSSANLYVCDTGNNTIRKITPDGTVTTLAGIAGVSGEGDGVGPSAQFGSPGSVAVDSQGNVYVLDANLRKISPPNASVITVANLSTTSTLGGLAVDTLGNVFVLDVNSERVTRYAKNGAISGAASGFRDFSTGLAIDTSGNLYATSTADIVAEVPIGMSSANVIGGSYGQIGSQDGTGDLTLFDSPGGIAANTSSVLFIADTKNNTIRVGFPPISSSSYSRIINLSVRAAAGAGNGTLIAGFVTGGPGTAGPLPVLVRGIGPGLAQFGVSGVLPDPVLSLYQGGTAIAQNTGWTANQSQITALDASTGAFPLNPASPDCALSTSIAPGLYSAELTSSGGNSALALAEVYDATAAGAYVRSSSRLVNVSARTNVGTGASVLIGGFVLTGNGLERVLVRGIGPGLTAFGVGNVLTTPQITLYDGQGAVIASNLGWGNSPQSGPSTFQATARQATSADMSAAGAFALMPGSADGAIVATLAPGAYSVVVSGAGNTTGVALVEIYELP